MSEAHPDRTPDDHRIARALAVAGLLIVVLTAALAGLLVSSFHNTIRREQTNLRNLAVALAAQTRSATLTLDMTLVRDAERVLDGSRAMVDTLAATVRNDVPTQVYALAPDGQHRTANAALPPSERVGPTLNDSPQIGIGQLEPASGRSTIRLVRNLPREGDKPAGAIVIETDAAYFQNIFAAVDLGRGGSVTLLRRDGTMLVRSPGIPGVIGRSFLNTPLFQIHLPRMPAGAFESTSPIDGTQRLYGYSTVARYPLVIITSRDKSDTLSVWYGWLWEGLLAWTILSATLALLAWRIGREASRQAALVTRLTASENQLAHSYRYLTCILDSLATPVWVLDAQRRIVLFNKAFQHFTGKPAQGLVGRSEGEVLDPDTVPARERLYAGTSSGGPHTFEADIRNGAGETRTAIQFAGRLESEDQETHIVSSLTDITERKQVEQRLAYLSDHDSLTGLPNHNQMRRVLNDAVRAAAGRGKQVTLLLIAFERLQEVAGLLGHEAGDEAVRQIAARLRSLAPQALCTARVKANEFGVVLLPTTALHHGDAFAFELHTLLSEPVLACEREFHLAPKIGIARFPQDANSVDELMRLAEIATHRAREDSGEPVRFHSESTHTELVERLSIEEQLRRAMERGELNLVYQPKVEIATGRVVGFEVLLRWDNPILGPVPPGRFIPLAEQTGLIVPIGNWVLQAACAEAAGWQREHGIRAKIAVNLSIRQFYQKNLLRSISDALASSGLAPDALELEITESIAMSRIDVVERLLRGIRELGVELAIDDFGTGYSSLAYLKRFPVQRLKIDQAFVCDLGRDEDSAAIVRSVVALGHGLQMRIVAEGVETDTQLRMLRELGCDEYQGFLFSRPITAAAVPALLGVSAPEASQLSVRSDSGRPGSGT